MAKPDQTQLALLNKASYLIRYLDPELLMVCLTALNGNYELAKRLQSYRGKLSKGDVDKRKIVLAVLYEILPELELATKFGLRGVIEYQLVRIEELRERAKQLTPDEMLTIEADMRGTHGSGYYEIKYITSKRGNRNGPYLYYRHQEGDIKGSKYVANLAQKGSSKRKIFK